MECVVGLQSFLQYWRGMVRNTHETLTVAILDNTNGCAWLAVLRNQGSR